MDYNEARYIEFPDDEGVMHLVDLEAKPDLHQLDLRLSGDTNQYYLFTRRNPDTEQILVMNNQDSITYSNFDASVPTAVIVHGWMNKKDSMVNTVLRNALLESYDYNVIIMDWSRVASLDYVTAVYGVPGAGRRLGQFLAFLNDVTGAPYSSMHIIGHSLGAHLVGNAGRKLNGQVARVTGLDPAGPLWYLNSKSLRNSDAVYVEAIHTNGGGLGIGVPTATADFFPNGGITQPGCVTTFCNHKRSWELFAATITYDHLVARKCSNNLSLSINICKGPYLSMGNAKIGKRGNGLYRLKTGQYYPY